MELPKELPGGLSALKNAKKLGDDTAKFVGEIQGDMEKTVRDEQKKRVQERKNQEQMLINAELNAIRKFEEEEQRKILLNNLKNDLTKKHGKDAWNKVQQLKTEIQNQNAQDMKYIDRDRHKVQDLFWYCVGVAAIITYLFKLYKF
jgi:hypothetical protein